MTSAAVLLAMLGQAAAPIDFAAVPRQLAREPAYVGKPAYGCFLFGERGEHRMWAVLDRSRPDRPIADVLWIDRDLDGELGEEGERIEGKVERGDGELVEDASAFVVGAVVIGDPEKGGAKHTDFRIVNRSRRISFRMNWRGGKVTMGPYAPAADEYAQFGPDLASAPLFVPGFDRPFQFERWIREPLRPGGTTDFKVFLGNRGSAPGTFSCVDDEFLPAGEFVVATLICTDTDGKEVRVRNELKERC